MNQNVVYKNIIVYGGLSDRGMRRPENQDFFGKFPVENLELSHPKGQLFIVADGMGGHERGREASETAVSVIKETYYADPSENINQSLLKAFESANSKIFQIANSGAEPVKMGTTCVAVVLTENQAYVAHVGDSRVYRISHGEIEQLTRDHTQVAELYRKGIITKEEAENHPSRSVLVRALGVGATVEIDILDSIPINPADTYILCTDGLIKATKDEIKEIVQSNSPQEACQALVNLANQRGGDDNITVQVIRIDQTIVEPLSKELKQEKGFPGKGIGLGLLVLLFILLIIFGIMNRETLLGWSKGKLQFLSGNEGDRPIVSEIDITESRSGNPDINVITTHANRVFQAGYLDSALVLYQNILWKNPMHLSSIDGIARIAEKYKNKADILREKQRFQDALLLYRNAADLRPKDQELRKRIALCEEQVKNALVTPGLLPPKQLEETASEAGSRNDHVPEAEPGKGSNQLLSWGIKTADWKFPGLSGAEYEVTNSGITFLNTPDAKKAIYYEDFVDVNIEVQANLNEGSIHGRLGIIMGYKEKVEDRFVTFYLFSITGRKEFLLERISAEKTERLLSVPIGAGSEEDFSALYLRAKCLGPWIMIYLNQKLLKAWLGKEIVKGNIGLFVDPNIRVEFSQFRFSSALENKEEN